MNGVMPNANAYITTRPMESAFIISALIKLGKGIALGNPAEVESVPVEEVPVEVEDEEDEVEDELLPPKDNAGKDNAGRAAAAAPGLRAARAPAPPTPETARADKGIEAMEIELIDQYSFVLILRSIDRV